jgi:YbbR domain-containing protein
VIEIWRRLTRNLIWKLASVAVAIGVWLAVASEPDLATIVSVPVEYRNYPSDLEISSNIMSTINVEARGPAGRLASLHDAGISAVIDFGSVTAPGERTFTLGPSSLNLPVGVNLIRTIPSQLRFTFEQHMTRMLPVDVPLSGTMPPDEQIASIEITPQELRVGGPQSHVMRATKLVADPVDVSHLTGNTRQTVAVYASDPEVRLLGPPQVTVKIQVQLAR